MPGRILRSVLPSPDDIVASYVTPDERFLLVDEPSTNAFLVEAANEIGLIVGVAVLVGFLHGSGAGSAVTLLGLAVIAALAVVLLVRRLQLFYTRYALTDFRVIRSSGVLTRRMAWIPWSRVTDVAISQSLAGRLLGYATVHIESANEASEFKAIKDLRDPQRFHRLIAEMVAAKQGRTVLRATPVQASW